MPLPPEQELVWIAGFLEGQGFFVGYRRGYLYISINMRFTRVHYLGRLIPVFNSFCVRHGQKTSVYRNKRAWSLGDRFLHDGRPALYSDQPAVRTVVMLFGEHAKAVIDALFPFFSAAKREVLTETLLDWVPPRKGRPRNEQVRLARELYGQGMQMKKIAQIVGLHYTTVSRHVKEARD
jgi:hypothetical protein